MATRICHARNSVKGRVTDALKVEQVPGEPDRFFVQSSSRPDLQHVVDLDFEGKPACGCEAFQARGARTCKHIQRVLEFKKHHETT